VESAVLYRIAAVSRPGPRQLITLAISALALAGLAGCTSGTNFDYDAGRTLFISKCGTCHTLAQAGTSAQVGPNLDDAFADARDEGMTSGTIRGVVHAQIENPRPADPSNTNSYMPPELVTGDDAENVAYYVGEVAGVPGAKPPPVPGGPGGQVFATNGCGSCHTLENFPNASGTTGPDLSKVLPGQSTQEIEQSIVDPNAKIAQGYPANVMPDNFKDQIAPDDLKALVQFLYEYTSKSGGGGK
jgi:mono/diheme cytochrome c family protein